MGHYNSDKAESVKARGNTVPAIFTMRLGPELKDAIGRAADKAGVPMNEYMAKVLAKHLGRPELAAIPRKSYGRPRKEYANGAV